MSDYTSETKFIDLAAQQIFLRADIDSAISKVLDHGHYIMGPEVKEVEEKLRTSPALGMSSLVRTVPMH